MREGGEIRCAGSGGRGASDVKVKEGRGNNGKEGRLALEQPKEEPHKSEQELTSTTCSYVLTPSANDLNIVYASASDIPPPPPDPEPRLPFPVDDDDVLLTLLVLGFDEELEFDDL